MLNNSWLRLILVKEVTDVCLYIQIIKDEYNTWIIYLGMEGMKEYGMRFTMQMGRKYIGIQITPICEKIDWCNTFYIFERICLCISYCTRTSSVINQNKKILFNFILFHWVILRSFWINLQYKPQIVYAVVLT